MQKIKFCVNGNETVGSCCDLSGLKNVAAPKIVIGAEVELNIILFEQKESNKPYDIESLSEVKSWRFVMDSDYDATTVPKIVADNAGIEVAEVDEIFNGSPLKTTQVKIPISNTVTGELIEAIGHKNMIKLNGELAGFDLSGRLSYILQIMDFTIMNRIAGAVDPEPMNPEFLNETQVRALLAAGFDLQFSDDLTLWHEIQAATDTHFRFRLNGNSAGEWSESVALICGPSGTNGANGTDGVTPHVDENSNHWFVGNSDTGVNASGIPGMDGTDGINGVNGITPHINQISNHWMIGDNDTGINASGELWQIPRVWYSFYDATYGNCNRMDETVNVLEFADVFDNVGFLKLKVQSASANIAGNIALNITITDGVNSETLSMVVPVTSTAAWQVIDLSTMTQKSGKLKIVRDYNSATDTLKDGATVVTAIITAVRFKEV